MKKYQDEEILNAKRLRQQFHYSFAELQRLTGIPATTIRHWCGNENHGTKWETLLISNERKRHAIRNSEIDVVTEFKDTTPKLAKMYTSLLYWCEGSKYPSTNKVCFTNSDPQLMQLFIILFRKAFPLDEKKLRAHVQMHTNHNIKDIHMYWSNLLDIPTTQFIKPTITEKKYGKHRSNYLGTCTIRYPDFRVLLKLMGIYESFFKQSIE
jgi:hypothetical protein